jgi:hypothetical protein
VPDRGYNPLVTLEIGFLFALLAAIRTFEPFTAQGS